MYTVSPMRDSRKRPNHIRCIVCNLILHCKVISVIQISDHKGQMVAILSLRLGFSPWINQYYLLCYSLYLQTLLYYITSYMFLVNFDGYHLLISIFSIFISYYNKCGQRVAFMRLHFIYLFYKYIILCQNLTSMILSIIT